MVVNSFVSAGDDLRPYRQDDLDRYPLVAPDAHPVLCCNEDVVALHGIVSLLNRLGHSQIQNNQSVGLVLEYS